MQQVTGFADVRAVLVGPMRAFYIGQLFSNIGGGLTLSLFIVYLSNVRGFPISTATLVLSWVAVVGLAVGPLMGSAVDRIGPRPVLIVSAFGMAGAVYGYAFITDVRSAVIAASAAAIFQAGIWSPAGTLIGRLVPEERHGAAFGLNFMLLNLGLGLGGLVGSLIVDVDQPETFELLYTLDAVTYIGFGVAILAMGRVGNRPTEQIGTLADVGGWREVLRDRNLLRMAVVSLALLIFGYSSMESGLAIYITNVAELNERWIGVVFFVNTMIIVVSQVTVIGLLRTRSRSRAIGAVGALWGAAWLLLPWSVGIGEALGVVVVCLAMGIFALGECVWSPTAPAVINALAPEHLRGRYNAVQGLTWSVAATLGPVLAGGLIGSGRGVLWAWVIGLGCLAAGAYAQTLRRHLPARVDGRMLG